MKNNHCNTEEQPFEESKMEIENEKQEACCKEKEQTSCCSSENNPALEAEDYKNKYISLLAEMENMRKRLQKEKLEAIRFSVEKALISLLPPIDHLEQALRFAQNMPNEVKNWALGFQMIVTQFKDLLAEQGIISFSSEGSPFDPNKHQAVEIEETDQYPEGVVIQEFTKGYRSAERTLRPARVKISKSLKPVEEKTYESTEEK
jgi:molecular chaperone GrpE